MNFIFSLLLFTHAIVHAAAFSRAFGMLDIEAIHKPVSHMQGIAWGICAVLFIVAASGKMLNKRSWLILALGGIIISQVVIFINWSYAGWGSVINLLILVVAIFYSADLRFRDDFRMQVRELLGKESNGQNEKITITSINHLPGPVQSWLMRAGVIGKRYAKTVRLKQKGKMKTTPAGSWMPFHAEQYITGTQPGYSWFTKVYRYPFLYLTGIDKLNNGKGSMRMKLLSVYNVVDIESNEQIDSGSMVRWLAEICWSPSLALHPLISWEEIDSHHTRAVMNTGSTQISGVFHFNSEGDVLKFTAQRYKLDKDHYSLETWQVDILDYTSFDGVRIPHRCRVSWKLPGGDFTWLELEITELEYNNPALYKD